MTKEYNKQNSSEAELFLNSKSEYTEQRLEYSKPEYSYAGLIAKAISSSPISKMTLKEIYEWIMANYPFYEHQKGNWQNSIRHNLSLNRAFYKVARDNSKPGKGAYWCLDKEAFRESVHGKLKKNKKNKFRDHQVLLNVQNHSISEILETEKKYSPHFEKIMNPLEFDGDLHNPDFYFENKESNEDSTNIYG